MPILATKMQTFVVPILTGLIFDPRGSMEPFSTMRISFARGYRHAMLIVHDLFGRT